MKAVIYTRYGPPEVLQVVEMEKPEPQPDQVLVRVQAASINAADYRLMRANPFLVRLGGGLFKPNDTRLGTDFAGIIEAAGGDIRDYQLGDEVFGGARGAFAEYACARAGRFTRKPASCSFEDAAAVPVAALTALQGLRQAGGVQPGQKVLIQGASGGVGLFAVQIARSYGAEVSAVCSLRNHDRLRSLGVERIIDYTRTDFTRNPERYDLILAVNGYHPLAAYKRCLAPQGVYVCAGGTLRQLLQAILLGPLLSEKGGRKLTSMGLAKFNQEDMDNLGKMLADGSLVPVIDRSYPLDDIVEAMHYVEDVHAQGKVVIQLRRQPRSNQDVPFDPPV